MIIPSGNGPYKPPYDANAYRWEVRSLEGNVLYDCAHEMGAVCWAYNYAPWHLACMCVPPVRENPLILDVVDRDGIKYGQLVAVSRVR